MTPLLLEQGASEGPSTDHALIVSGSEYSVVPVEQRLERLRRDREVHSYKQIWTKDARGGPYRKAAGRGFDPLLQLPDGTDRQVELGYERVEQGPTTNFVGNHMTQGAIDLVQAELQHPSDSQLLLLLEGEEEGSPGATRGPQLLGHLPADSGRQQAGPRAKVGPSVALQQYSWWDSGEAVYIQVDLPRCREQLRCSPAAATALQLTCSFSQRSMRLELLCLAMSGGCIPAAALLPSMQLTMDPLRHEIQPGRCTVAVGGGPLALSAPQLGPHTPVTGAAAPPAAIGDGPGKEDGSPVVSVASSEAQLGPDPASSSALASDSSDGACTTSLLVPPGAATVVVRLLKANPTQGSWDSLRADMSLERPQRQQGQPDLAALRRAAKQRRAAYCVAAATLGLDGKVPSAECAAVDSSAPRPGSPTPEQGQSRNPTPRSAGGSHPFRADLLSTARHSVQAGQYQAAVDACTALLQRWEAEESPQHRLEEGPGRGGTDDPAVEALALKAECHCQLGSLKQAIADYSAALQLCNSGHGTAGAASSQASHTRLLLARAAAFEQLEQYASALEDLRRVAELQQPAVSSQVVLGLQRVGRSLRQAERFKEQEDGEGGMCGAQPPSVPRQSKLFSGRPRRLV